MYELDCSNSNKFANNSPNHKTEKKKIKINVCVGFNTTFTSTGQTKIEQNEQNWELMRVDIKIILNKKIKFMYKI